MPAGGLKSCPETADTQVTLIPTSIATEWLPARSSFFFFQAEDGIRDDLETGVQTCALPICHFHDIMSGNLGISIYSQRPIAEDLWTRLPATLELTLTAITLSVALGIPLGVISALKRNSLLDHILRVISVSGLAIAAFWLALLLQFFFAMKLGVAPLNSRIDGFGPTPVTGLMIIDSLLDWDIESLHSALSHIALPALTLALPAAATIVRFTRAGVLDVINSNHVLYQRAMGLPPGLIVWKYVLRNALISTVTQIGLIFGVLVTNAVIVETVFDWPGMGTFAVQSILQSDHKAIIGFTIWIGALIVIVNLLVDITHSFIDPRGSR